MFSCWHNLTILKYWAAWWLNAERMRQDFVGTSSISLCIHRVDLSWSWSEAHLEQLLVRVMFRGLCRAAQAQGQCVISWPSLAIEPRLAVRQTCALRLSHTPRKVAKFAAKKFVGLRVFLLHAWCLISVVRQLDEESLNVLVEVSRIYWGKVKWSQRN